MLHPFAPIDPAMAAFVLSTAAIPGPNAVLMLAVGSRVGARAGVPILVGMAAGNALAKGATAAGIRWAAGLDPLVIHAAQWTALAFLIWFTLRILRRRAAFRVPVVGVEQPAAEPVLRRFMDGFGFQLCNPLVWITGFAAAALFCSPALDEAQHAIAFGAVAFPSAMVGADVWLLLGQRGARWLASPLVVRGLDTALVGLLALAALPVFLT